jgi:hypothetical protein
MRKAAIIVALCVVLAATGGSAALAESWSSFIDATFHGIHVHPMLATGTTDYTVTLDPGAGIAFGGNSYQISWIGGFYVNSANQGEFFAASDANGQNDWSWEEKGGNSAGWKCHGNAGRLFPATGDQKTFHFGDLNLGTTSVYPGFHIGYLDGSTVQSAFFSGYVPDGVVGTTPEPSGLLAGMMFLTGAGVIARRRFRKTA